MNILPKPIMPGQVYSIPVYYNIKERWYYYIVDYAAKSISLKKEQVYYKIYKLYYVDNTGFLYRTEEVTYLDHESLASKLKTGTYIKTLKPKLEYETFIDTFTQKDKRILFIIGFAIFCSNLTLLVIWTIIGYG